MGDRLFIGKKSVKIQPTVQWIQEKRREMLGGLK